MLTQIVVNGPALESADYRVSAETYPKWKVLPRDFCNTSFPWLNFSLSALWILD